MRKTRLAEAENPRVRPLVHEWLEQADADPSVIDASRRIAKTIEQAVRAPAEVVLSDPDATELHEAARSLAGQPELLIDAQRQVQHLRDWFTAARTHAEARSAVTADPSRRADVVLFREKSESLLGRRSARQWLDANAPGSAGTDAALIESWRQFWDAWFAIQSLVDALPRGLRTEVPKGYEPELVSEIIRRAAGAVELADAQRLARSTTPQSPLPLPIEELANASEWTRFRQELEAWLQALELLDANRLGGEVKDAGEVEFARDRLVELDQLLDERKYGEAAERLEELERVVDALPDLARRCVVLDGPTGALRASVEAIESAAAAEADRPDFMDDLPTALGVHAKVLRLEAIRTGTSTADIAAELKSLRDEVLDDARRLLGLRIQSRIVEGFRNPRFLASLEAFKKAIRSAAKRFERIEALKNSEEFDIQVLTDVFPCWIMRPEDACRVFPLAGEIFDVVIFDEASQCNPDQALPLFGRAKQLAIFGDAKQLSNEDLRRTLAGSINQSLMRGSGLDGHDPARLFDQTQNSLLELISNRAQAAIVLNEHFRCRPELIAFSNDAFYGNALQVMRDREDDRGLGPPFLIRELADVPPLGKSKLNPYEAELVLDELERRLADARYEALSFGLLSLFREQTEHMEELVEKRVSRELRVRHRIICSTVDGFQGDERDVILYSWRFTRTSSPSILAFTSGEAGSQRTNVALTRARHQAIHFISAPVDRFPQGARNVTGFLRHARQPGFLMASAAARVHHEPRDTWRSRVSELLSDEFDVEERFIAAGCSVDLKISDPETGSRLAVFVDSKLDPLPPAVAVRRIDGQGLLERSGWRVLRLPAAELDDSEEVRRRVREALATAPPRPRTTVEESDHRVVRSPSAEDVGFEEAAIGPVAPEDRADYHWDPGTVEDRLSAGEDIFESEFERELYDRLAADPNLTVVPQWPSRDKRIDLVVTDRDGRRLAVEADGDIYHATADGDLIPDDLNRQELLEEAGWVFHRIRHSEFTKDREAAIEKVRSSLAAVPANAALAEQLQSVSVAPQLLPEPGGVEPTLPAELVAPPPVTEPDENPVEPEPDVVSEPPSPSEPTDTHESPSVEAPSTSAEPTAAPPTPLTEWDELDDAPLDWLAAAVLDAIREIAEPSDDVFIALMRKQVTFTHARERLLRSFAWYLAGKKILERTDDTWRLLAVGDVELPQVSTYSINKIAERAKELLGQGVDEKEVFNQLMDEISSAPRLPKPYVRAIGAGIWKATNG